MLFWFLIFCMWSVFFSRSLLSLQLPPCISVVHGNRLYCRSIFHHYVEHSEGLFDLQMHAFEFEKIFLTKFFFLISFLHLLSSSYSTFFRTLSLFHGWNFFSFLSEEIRIFLFVLLWFLSLLISWSQFLRGLSFSVLVCIFHIHSFPQISEKPCFCSATCLNGKLSRTGSFSVWVTQASLKGIGWILWCETSVSHHQSLLWPSFIPYRRCF